MPMNTVLDKEVFEKALQLGDLRLKFEFDDLGPEYEEKARRELRETPEVVAKAITDFKKLLEKETDLNFPRDEEFLLKMFLRRCKFYPESAFTLAKNFYKFKAKHPKYYDKLLPSCTGQSYEQKLLTIIPSRTSAGERVLIIEPGRKWIPKGCTLVDLARGVFLTLEAAISEQRTQIAGAHVILDMEGLSMNHVWQFTPSFAKDILEFIQECAPIRMKWIHVVYQPYIFNMVYAIFKPFISPKIRSRIAFHGTNFHKLHEVIDRSILPPKYEGTANFPLDAGDKLLEYIKNFEPEFVEMSKRGYTKDNK